MNADALRDIDIARLMAANLLPSPFPFYSSTLVKMKVSGTGVSYRHKHSEFVHRDPKIYLSREFCDRVRGTPVIAEHPRDGAMVDADTLHSEGRLVARQRTLPSGHRVIEWHGSPLVWMNPLSGTRRYITKISTKFDN